ncbi:hypothetical protein GCM10022268_27090 [Sphingomonas cynarae]|uniref:Ice-binding protein C-terminal domain-containing protein n=1 Tax=Sphingomonas cynarae TaxID=930197 RepID=A0ABP7ECG9_9SPHN
MRFGLAVAAIGLVTTPAAAVWPGAVFGTAAATSMTATGADIVRMPVDRSGTAFADCTTRPGEALCGAGRAADILFVDLADPGRPTSTRSFSLLAAEDGAMLTAYDAAGHTIGSVRGAGDGERVTLVGAITRIAVRPAAAIRSAPVDTAMAMSHVPEPATWAMLMIGFGMIAAGVRRWMRRSQARFDERIRRIAAGEAI